jgi:hypothetical protein
MAVESSPSTAPRWRAATIAAVAVWIAFAIRLMIADVWDETNGMLAFSSAAMPLLDKVRFVLTQSLGFWRPLPTLLVTVVLHFVRDFDVSWRVLRAVNAAMLLTTLWLFWRTLTETDGDEPANRARRMFALTIAFLFSGSAVITAGWYANVFDASALLLIAVALRLLLRGRALTAGGILGAAFFCKETTALALPFLVMLFAARRITFRQLLRAGIPAALLGAVYFFIRSKIVPFGSAGDVHGFSAGQLLPTLAHLAESFWRQTLKGNGPGVLGFVWLALSLAALRKPRLIGATVLFLLATGLIYWGMFGEYQRGILMHHLDFAGRLYLIPAALLLFLLALERQTLAIAVLCVPILLGGYTTWRDHARFQRTYKRIYRTASTAKQKPLLVHFPTKPLEDTVRGIRIGDFPASPVKVDPVTGRLSY